MPPEQNSTTADLPPGPPPLDDLPGDLPDDLPPMDSLHTHDLLPPTLPPDDTAHLPPPDDLPPAPKEDAKAQRNREKAAEKLQRQEEKAAKVAVKKGKEGEAGTELVPEPEAEQLLAAIGDLPPPPDDLLPPPGTLPADGVVADDVGRMPPSG